MVLAVLCVVLVVFLVVEDFVTAYAGAATSQETAHNNTASRNVRCRRRDANPGVLGPENQNVRADENKMAIFNRTAALVG